MADIGLTGYSWRTDIRSTLTLPVDHNYGWGSINVKAKKPALTGKENIVYKYSHATGSGSVGFNIGVGSLSFRGSASNDTAGSYKQISC